MRGLSRSFPGIGVFHCSNSRLDFPFSHTTFNVFRLPKSTQNIDVNDLKQLAASSYTWELYLSGLDLGRRR